MTGAGRFVVVLASALAAACSSMNAAVDIHAPSSTVWAVLSDVEHYHCWNPFFVSARGTLREGGSLHLTLKPVGKSAQSFSPTVLDLTPGRRIVWRGRVLLPGLFDGRHTLLVEPIDAMHTRFRQEESFSGVLVPFVGFEPYRAGWERMNQALKQRAEAFARALP